MKLLSGDIAALAVALPTLQSRGNKVRLNVCGGIWQVSFGYKSS